MPAISPLQDPTVPSREEHQMSKKKNAGSGSTGRRQGEETRSRVADVLVGGEMSVEEVASALGIGPTSARKHLAALEASGRATRSPGGREGRRRLPDRFRAAGATGADPAGSASGTGRLRPGALDPLVLGYLTDHPGEGPLGPAAVAKGLGRSSGAVANCLVRLADAGEVIAVGDRPRRYAPSNAAR
jgi:DNA-binding transcriptional ArsR family regulator